MATFRVTGPVLASKRRKGTAKGSGNPYDFTTITVLVGGRGTVELTLPEDPALLRGSIPQEGELVDLTVEVTPRATGFGTEILGIYSGAADEAFLAAA